MAHRQQGTTAGIQRASAAHPLLGATLGGYVVRRKLGDCGMGPVFEALDERGRRVALRVISARFATSGRVMARISEEAEASARVHHPNVVACYGVGRTEEGTCFVAWEFVEGEELIFRLLQAWR